MSEEKEECKTCYLNGRKERHLKSICKEQRDKNKPFHMHHCRWWCSIEYGNKNPEKFK
jgi:hypothetical protein